MASDIRVERFSGGDAARYIDEVARLRMEVFREFPYLYDGSLTYEEEYLATYSRCEDAVVVVAFADTGVVGASTGIPMEYEEDSFRRPFVEAGYDPARVFYCAESVLLKPYRGQGVGGRFFREREAHAREVGDFDWFTFCAVQRPDAHPLRPASYRPLDDFWHRRGYRRQPALKASYRWKDVDREEETSKTLVFWVKSAVSR